MSSRLAKMVDDAEAQATELGAAEPLCAAAQLLGFDHWRHVVRLAREENHRVAIELLCRRAERSL